MADSSNIHYMTRDMVLHDEYTIQWHPVCLVRKVKVVQRGKAYMRKLTKACADEHAKKSDGAALARYPYMVHWHRTGQYVLMQLSNGTIQVSFFLRYCTCSMVPAFSWRLKEVIQTFLFPSDQLPQGSREDHLVSVEEGCDFPARP
jgi:polo-like kinase 1